MLRVLKWVSILVCLVAVGIVVEGFVLGSDVSEERYGIDPRVTTVLFIIAEVLFDASVIGLAVACGYQVRWREALSFNFESFHGVSTRGAFMNSMILTNAIGWTMPFFYLLIAGWGRLPLAVSGAIALEIVLHIILCVYVKGWVKI